MVKHHRKPKRKKKTPPKHRKPPARSAPKPQPVPKPPVVPPRPSPPVATPLGAYTGPFGVRQAERLLWRAGFGPSPGHAEALAAMGVRGAVASLTRPVGPAVLSGAEPTDDDGNPLAPEDVWGHDHLWWFDRMVRTNQPLVERMTLIWHDWFATSLDGVGQQNLMLDQNELFRGSALGSFDQLLHDVTEDPAMIVWLNLADNTRSSPNENYAREVMELFTLGADRGAYTEDDVRELARALTGFRYDWSSQLGAHNFRFDPARHDAGTKSIFGKSGAYSWDEAVAMIVRHPMHASHFVSKLWGYFIPTPPPANHLAELTHLYVSSGWQVRPVLEAILLHPDLHTGPRMVKPPVVFAAGMLRALRRPVDIASWAWLSELTGQFLFRPPDVSGWDDARWLDTGTVRGRWEYVRYGIDPYHLEGTAFSEYDPTETADAAVTTARAFWGNPALTPETVAGLTSFAAGCVNASLPMWQQKQYRAARQNALRQLIYCSPDLQVA